MSAFNECLNGYNLDHLYLIFFVLPVRNIDSSLKYWSLVVANVQKKELYLLAHKHVEVEELNTELVQIKISLKLNELLNLEIQWRFNPYTTYGEVPIDSCDSGVYIVTCLYMLLIECPIVIHSSSFETYRYNFAYWMMKGALGY